MGFSGGEGCQRPKGNTFLDSPYVCASPQNTQSPRPSLPATVLTPVWAPSPPACTATQLPTSLSLLALNFPSGATDVPVKCCQISCSDPPLPPTPQ